MLEPTELSARWSRVCEMMAERDLDVIIAIDISRDEIMLGQQRWLTGFTPLGQPAAALVFRDGRVELVSPALGKTAPAFYAAAGLAIEMVPGFSAELLAQRVGRVAPRRVGYAEAHSLPAGVADAIRALPSAPELVDAGCDLLRLRQVKSLAEQNAVRRSCAIADTIWEQVPEIFRVGRKFFEVVADIDHIVKREGGESGFYLLARLPIFGLPMQVMSDPEEIVDETRYMLEISPRFQGYYSQLTAPVITGTPDAAIRKAYEDVVAAKEMAAPLMVPGADLTEIAARVDGFLAERGHTIASRSLGHFCGMALEEPRHDSTRPHLLEAGMTLIFHPVIASLELMSLMRADTYLITPTGAERLNRYPMDLLRIG